MKSTVPLAELVEDSAVYPRHAVDGSHVAALVQALKSSNTLPLIVVDAKTKRIVDGWHRSRAYRQVLGDTAAVDVDLRTYKDEQELVLDSIALNSAHGRRFDKVDLVRAIILAENAGVTTQRVACALHITEQRAETLKVRCAIAPVECTGAVDGTLKVVLKRPMSHFAGTTMTAEQVAAHASQAGTSFLLQVHQLRDAMVHGLMNTEDGRLVDALRELHGVMTEYLGKLP